MDAKFFEYAQRRLDASLVEYGGMARIAIEALHNAKNALEEYCGCADLSVEEEAYCEWQHMEDVKFEPQIDMNGYTRPIYLPALRDVGL